MKTFNLALACMITWTSNLALASTDTCFEVYSKTVSRDYLEKETRTRAQMGAAAALVSIASAAGGYIYLTTTYSQNLATNLFTAVSTSGLSGGLAATGVILMSGNGQSFSDLIRGLDDDASAGEGDTLQKFAGYLLDQKFPNRDVTSTNNRPRRTAIKAMVSVINEHPEVCGGEHPLDIRKRILEAASLKYDELVK